jgi:hypothetical protein
MYICLLVSIVSNDIYTRYVCTSTLNDWNHWTESNLVSYCEFSNNFCVCFACVVDSLRQSATKVLFTTRRIRVGRSSITHTLIRHFYVRNLCNRSSQSSVADIKFYSCTWRWQKAVLVSGNGANCANASVLLLRLQSERPEIKRAAIL